MVRTTLCMPPRPGRAALGPHLLHCQSRALNRPAPRPPSPAVVAIEAEYLASQLAELPAMQAALEAGEAAKCEEDHTGLAAHVCC